MSYRIVVTEKKNSDENNIVKTEKERWGNRRRLKKLRSLRYAKNDTIRYDTIDDWH